MKLSNKSNPTLIRVTSNNEIIGHMTCEEFMKYMGRTNFITSLDEDFNNMKEKMNEPERVEQILNCK